MKKIQFEIKSIDEAADFASKELRISKEFIEIEVLEKKGLIKKIYTIEAKSTVNPAELGYQILTDMFENMEITAQIEMRKRNNNEIKYTVNSGENPLMIGKNGKTLENIQFFIRNVVNSYSDEHLMVLVDIGGYKANRKRQLEIIATKTAKDVARSKIEAKLDPMNAYERRIIHTKLSDWRDVSTKSEGDNPNRYVVIKPKRR